MKKLLIAIFSFATLQVAAQSDSTVTFTVFGNCEMCKERIETASKGKGVITAMWDIDSKILTLHFNPTQTSPEKVQQRIADSGHDTELKKAKDYVYKDLPECCLYRDKESGSHSDQDGEGQDKVMGVVMESDDKGNFKPLSGANILLKGSQTGVATSANGFFSLTLANDPSVITISYVGYLSKDITISKGQHLNIVLNRSTGLQEVKVVAGRSSMYVPNKSVIRTQIMSEKELFKAACCNLSESFETNPSVDVSYNDAVTGSKQIQLLGLSGNYSQLTVENMPGPRGIATPWGLNSIPGTWVESIQLTKGVGSVVNGFESITGQVNVELKKPELADRLYANVYVNNMGKTDLNLNLTQKLNSKWSTALLLHDAFFNNNAIDFNKDSFRDLPTGNLFTLMNRWKFDNSKGVMGQFGFRILTDNKVGGQTSFEEKKHKLTTDYYGVGIQTDRQEIFGKLGYVFPEKKYKSFGMQLAVFRHKQGSYFGLTTYNALQKNFYANFIYQSIIGNTNHKFRTGVSFIADDYDEAYKSTIYKRKENTPGAFFEYTYNKGEKFDVIAGIRADHNSLSGLFFTPRLHVRFQPAAGTVLRFGTGRGQRTANIFAENTSVFVSSRNVSITPVQSGIAYGLKPEVAWSSGIGIDQRFRLFGRRGNIALDFFRTDFINQVIVDVDQSARLVHFYNLDGRSFANSFQAEMNYELFKKLELRMAYRLFDVKSTYHNKLMERPLISKQRGFINLAYEVSRWKIDYTVTFNGSKRIPFTGDNPPTYQLETHSPSYVLMNAQVTKTFGNKFPIDIYLGSENITNYFQENAIVAAGDPFGQYFDASMVWGPLSGRMIYGGVRLRIK